MSDYLLPRLRSLTPYTPGEQPQDQRYVKLNTNESPFPPSPRVLAVLSPEQIAANTEAARIASIPHSLTRRQFKLALIRSGLYEMVESMLSATTDLELRVTYQEAQDFERDHPMIVQMAESLGKTDAELDDLFILGGTL